MAWKGFLTESKQFMNYPKCGRLYFWIRFPKAALGFCLSSFCDYFLMKITEKMAWLVFSMVTILAGFLIIGFCVGWWAAIAVILMLWGNNISLHYKIKRGGL